MPITWFLWLIGFAPSFLVADILFESDILPSHDPFRAVLGNGYVGTRVLTPTFHVAGVYNGRWEPGLPSNDRSHRADLPVTTNVHIATNSTVTYSMDITNAAFTARWEDELVNYEQKLFAHRTLPHLYITELTVTNDGNETASIPLENYWEIGGDTDLEEHSCSFSTNVRCLVGSTLITEIQENQPTRVAIAWNDIPSVIHVDPSETFSRQFLLSVATSLNSTDPLEAALMYLEEGKEIYGRLFEIHAQEWKQLWKDANVELENNDAVTDIAYSSIYGMLTSIRSDWVWSLAPTDLSGGGRTPYWGNVFWDFEIWMYPPLLLLHPDLARTALQYRLERIPQARVKAIEYGYTGCMFPWQSAFSGSEIEYEQWGRYQHHITGDVAFALKQYWDVTHDLDWLKHVGYPLAECIGNYWASRVEYDPERASYVINEVMPPDEYNWPVDNSVYTNVIAKISLEFAISSAQILQIEYPDEWAIVASEMFILFDEELQYHPEYDGFDPETDLVKQADVILLGYPLMYDMPLSVRENDLVLYENITDPNGPAMTHAMFNIGWLELQKFDLAHELFRRGYVDNIQEPFKIWTEVTNGRGAANFITGGGGFLQSLMFGYGGLRIHAEYLEIRPVTLPPDTDRLVVRGIHYLGHVFSEEVRDGGYSIAVISIDKAATELYVRRSGGRMQGPLRQGEFLSYALGEQIHIVEG